MDRGRSYTRRLGRVKEACDASLKELSNAKVMCIDREQ